jgi:hypothetical protein
MPEAPTVHLIGIGRVPAKYVADLVPGDRIVWNYGYVYRVESVEPRGAQSVRIQETSERDGNTYTRTMRVTRLVGYLPGAIEAPHHAPEPERKGITYSVVCAEWVVNGFKTRALAEDAMHRIENDDHACKNEHHIEERTNAR